MDGFQVITLFGMLIAGEPIEHSPGRASTALESPGTTPHHSNGLLDRRFS
jgi:hypothetical protein